MRVELNIQEIKEAIEDYFSKKGVIIKKDTVKLVVDTDYDVEGASAELERVFN